MYLLAHIESLIEQSKELVPFKFIMRVIGAYGIIQVFAQDIGVPTGCAQARFMHNLAVQLIVFTCSAYAVTDDFMQSFLGTTIYMVMKHVLSKNETNDVCFPSKTEVEKCGEK